MKRGTKLVIISGSREVLDKDSFYCLSQTKLFTFLLFLLNALPFP